MIEQEVSLTDILAAWGAATGTIGTVIAILGFGLRYRQFKADKPKLKADVQFQFNEHKPNHIVNLRSVGRRPVTIDYIEYIWRPKRLVDRLRIRWLVKAGRYVRKEPISNSKPLQDGEKATYSLPSRLIPVQDILAIRIVDQAGRRWTVPWFSQKTLNQIATGEEFESEQYEQGKRHAKLTLFRRGREYALKLFVSADKAKGGSIPFRIFRTREELNSFSELVKEKFIPNFLNSDADISEVVQEFHDLKL